MAEAFQAEIIAPEKRLASTVSVPQRLMSIDALRGFDMFWIIGAESLFAALNRMNHSGPIGFIVGQLIHCEWEGFHFEDLIFPLFVFIMGVSTVFSLGTTLQQKGRARAVKKVVVRGSLLFIVGLIYSGGFSNEWPEVRLLGVLNRIALCYCFGGLIFCFFNTRAMIGICVALLVGYWALLAFVPFPDVRPIAGGEQVINKESGFTNVVQLNLASTNMISGKYIQGVNLANYLDQKYLPGKKWDGTWDPEGILSTMPAVASCLLGIFAGLLLRSPSFCDKWKIIYLLSFGAAGVLLGILWGAQFPIIKKIWTSSYVLVAGGLSAMLLGAFYWVVDVLKCQKWCQPFVWIGMNSITIYLVRNFIGGFQKLGARLAGGDVQNFLNNRYEGLGDLIVAMAGLLVAFWLANFLYRKKVFLRL